MNGIFVAMMVTNCTFDSSGRLAMNATCCADMVDVHPGLDRHLAVGLHLAVGRARRHRRRGVADVDLAGADVVLPAIQRDRFGQAGDACLVAV